MSRQFIAIIRHGDYHQLAGVPSAHQPFALTEQGQQQSKQATDSINTFCMEQNCVIDGDIASSELLRAWQTASLISQHLSSKPNVVSTMALAERSVGTVANLTISEIEQAIIQDPRYTMPHENWKSDSHYQLPFAGAESLLMAGQRVADYMSAQMKIASYKSENTLKLFVGHGAAFRHAAYHLGVLEFEQIKQLSMFHAQAIFCEISSDGRWQHIAGDWKKRQITDKLD